MRITAYAHANKEYMWQLGEKSGLKGEALEMFKHALTEVIIDLDVDPNTGHAEIARVDGHPLGELEV